jgi:glycosyltransferase involved in cell wall biosynthesis
MKNRKNLLFISSHLPSLKVPQAGQKIAYSALKEYSREFTVYLVSFYNEIEQGFLNSGELDFCEEVHLFKVSRRERLLGVLANPLLPVRVAARESGKVHALLARLVGEVDFEGVHFEFTSAAAYLGDVPKQARKIITEHDVTYQSLERRYRLGGLFGIWYRFEHLRQKRWELRMLSEMDEIVILNDKDRSLLVSDGIAPSRLRILAPQVDQLFKDISRESLEEYSILFWGAMNRQENIDAVKWFVKSIFPFVLSEVPNAKFYVVGVDPPAEISNLSSSNIIVTGFVENPAKYFETCRIAVAPLRMGAGIKVKVLEYLAAGIPVVSTSVGAEGIDDERLIIVDDSEYFAKAVTGIITAGQEGDSTKNSMTACTKECI